jgi:hypothetical protein
MWVPDTASIFRVTHKINFCPYENLKPPILKLSEIKRTYPEEAVEL